MDKKEKCCPSCGAPAVSEMVLKERIDRIARMEHCFDELLAAEESGMDEDRFKALLSELIEYYEGGQWLSDYELDEKGLLPQELKRGVLSEDGVYNFLSSIE